MSSFYLGIMLNQILFNVDMKFLSVAFPHSFQFDLWSYTGHVYCPSPQENVCICLYTHIYINIQLCIYLHNCIIIHVYVYVSVSLHFQSSLGSPLVQDKYLFFLQWFLSLVLSPFSEDILSGLSLCGINLNVKQNFSFLKGF